MRRCPGGGPEAEGGPCWLALLRLPAEVPPRPAAFEPDSFPVGRSVWTATKPGPPASAGSRQLGVARDQCRAMNLIGDFLSGGNSSRFPPLIPLQDRASRLVSRAQDASAR